MNDGLRLITRGDDAGSCVSANRAIHDAWRDGLLRNTSVMVPAPELADAALRLAEAEGLCLGLHATLNAEWDRVRWGPVLPAAEVPSLVQPDGTFFPTTRALRDHVPQLDEVLAELQAQLDRGRAAGFDFRYADTHMGFLWVLEGLAEAFADWCTRNELIDAHRFDGRLPWPADAADRVTGLVAALQAAADGTYVLVGHPAYDGDDLRRFGHAGYESDQVAAERQQERCLFTNTRVAAVCRERGVRVVRYDEAASVAAG